MPTAASSTDKPARFNVGFSRQRSLSLHCALLHHINYELRLVKNPMHGNPIFLQAPHLFESDDLTVS